MPSQPQRIVVLGTGGTISAIAESAEEQLRYRAGEVGVAALAAALPSTDGGLAIETEQVAQLDSKDMDFATWRRLAGRVAWHLAREAVRGVVVTHGTDTLEETAWFLQRLLAPAKPVVLTGAMRPASSSAADGPGNLAQAVAVAATRRQGGVVVAFAGALHGARAVRKTDPTRLDAFAGGLDAAAVDAAPIGLDALPDGASPWPFVAIVSSGAGADPRSVDALVAAGADGIVVATTGNGTVHEALEAALRRAMAGGVAVLRSSRFAGAGIVEPVPPADDALPSAGDLSPQKARVELILRLLADRVRRRRA